MTTKRYKKRTYVDEILKQYIDTIAYTLYK